MYTSLRVYMSFALVRFEATAAITVVNMEIADGAGLFPVERGAV